MINKYIADICDILDISVPTISYDTSHFQSLTMMAQCNLSNTTIFLRKKEKPDYDYFFAIAHELRHLWQIKTNQKKYLSDYKTADTIGLDQYNLQLAELDANAFATIIMREFFNIQAQFTNLSTTVKKEIYNRADVIESSLIL